MIVQLVTYESSLSEAEVRETIADRQAYYRALPGLLQKIYVRESETGEYGGIYLWEGEVAMEEFRVSDLARGIAGAYQVEGQPRVRLFEVLSVLRTDDDVLVSAGS